MVNQPVCNISLIFIRYYVSVNDFSQFQWVLKLRLCFSYLNSLFNGWFSKKRFDGQNVLGYCTCDRMTFCEVKLVLSAAECVGIC